MPIMYKPVSRFGIRSIFFCGSTGIGRCDMSFGKMNTFAEITEIRNVKDSEGFSSKR